MDSRITFSESIPGDMRAIIADYLEPWDWLLPRWLQTLDVELLEDGEGVDNIAECSANDVYSRAALHIYSSWFTDPPAKRTKIIVHELLHIPSLGLYENIKSAIELLTEDKLVRKLLAGQISDKYERMVQDLADRLTARGSANC